MKVEHILETLFECEGIEYVDITSYNFMEDVDGKIWIIDFGDAYYTLEEKGAPAANWFLRSVLAGESGKAWNPDFA
jgi:RIO-like serine/threonine protein kinase